MGYPLIIQKIGYNYGLAVSLQRVSINGVRKGPLSDENRCGDNLDVSVDFHQKMKKVFDLEPTKV